ncbi:cytochrome C554 [candidate division KSB1 bacterium]|nr:cytochrome C554 [candidate division KSB1 bacterium]
MRHLFSSLIVLISMSVIFLGSASDDEKKDMGNSTYKYVGIKNCKMCHNRPNAGKQFDIWSKGPHAKAYSTLATDEAREVARKLGLVKDPQQEDQCLRCHVTGFGVTQTQKASTYTMEEGVSCEACHGPGSVYRNMKVMKDIYEKKVDGKEYGLIEQNQAVCTTCHNENSPTYRELNYELAVKLLAHPVAPVTQ